MNLGPLYTYLRILLTADDGQDLVEYALVVALIGFAAIVGMGFLSAGINNAYSSLGSHFPHNPTP